MLRYIMRRVPYVVDLKLCVKDVLWNMLYRKNEQKRADAIRKRNFEQTDIRYLDEDVPWHPD
jgi:hypothetical protein